MKTVAFVPIKLNSQRLPHKNILPVAGRPLCWYICNSLTQVKEIDEIYVYCSDKTIKNYIPEEIMVKIRPSYLDGDMVKGSQIYRHFINEVDADIYVLAHTTSPFIEAKTIQNALRHVVSGKYDSSFSAKKIQTFAWYKDHPINYELTDVPRTQDLEPVWIETSGFFIFKKEIFMEHGRRIGFQTYIQEVSEKEAIDIDTKQDYDLACMFADKEKH
ncbi:MAG: acylneuraminate cytidylyltransferase family protein [Lachnospiraceae bacterium]